MAVIQGNRGGSARGEVRDHDRLFDVVIVLSLIFAAFIAFLAVLGGPVSYSSPLVLFYIGAFLFVAALGFFRLSRPSISTGNVGFILQRRRLFGLWEPREVIAVEQISKVLVLTRGRGTGLLLELKDGRQFSFPRTRLGNTTYNALAQLAHREGSGA